MRKVEVIVAIIAALFAAVVVADEKCFKHDYYCADEGAKCIGDFINTPPEKCFNESRCCAYPLFCINGTCEEDNRGMACKTNDDCYAASYGTHLIACIKNKCVVQGSFNDSCLKDDHCAGDQLCVKGLCDGLNESATCFPVVNGSNFECGANKTCIDGVCKAALALGAKCKLSVECDVYSICNDGKCIKRWSAEKNSTCESSEACAKGLYCDMNDHTCKEGIDRQYIVCTSDKDCESYGNSTCSECDAVEGKMFCKDPENVKPDCIAEMAAAYECYRKNGCAPLPSSSLDTCAQLECTAETNAIFTCQTKCEEMKRVSGAKCLAGIMLRYCPLLPTWLRIVIAFSILIVIIVVVFVIYGIYRCCCQKGDYSQVPSSEGEATTTTQG